MRVMYDSTDALSLPPGADLYAGYDDGHWDDAAAIAAKFPGVPVVRVTTNPADNEGDCLDIENGDASPTEGPWWTTRRRLTTGRFWFTNYCNLDTWPAARQAYADQGVLEPLWWIAAAPGIGPSLYPGTVAHQYAQGGNGAYDISVVADYWPGVDPDPLGDLMGITILDRHIHDDGTVETKLLAVGAGGNTPQGHLLYIDMKEADPSSASVIDVTVGVANKNNGWQLIVAP